MAKNNNVMTEIHALVQQIKNNFQEGVDFEILYWVKPPKNKYESGAIKCLSPSLKKFCREWFNVPDGVNDYLDYHKNVQRENKYDSYYYRVEEDEDKEDKFESLYWHEGGSYRIEQEEPRNCAVCGTLTFEENGRFWVWNKKTVGKGFGEKSEIIAYLHPQCAKKYFADKEQPNENNTRIKEKLLRNLDKICLDPIGWLANAEIVKGDIEKYYYKGNPKSKELEAKIHKVEIEGEEINLTYLEGKIKREIRKAITNEIKQNPQDWKIENSNIYDIPTQNIPDNFKILKHKSGRRHWNIGIIHFNESLEKGKQDWAEIEALLNGQPLPKPTNKNNQITNTQKTQLLHYFLTHNISKITLVDDKLTIEYKGGEVKKEVNDAEIEKYKNLIENSPNHSLSLTDLQKTKQNSFNPTKNPQDNKLVIGLALGAGAVALVGIVVYLIHKRKKN